MEKNKFNVIVEDFNTREFVSYDVMPYLRERMLGLSKAKRPKNRKETEEFIKKWASYQWWSRSEYEIVLCPLIPYPDDDIGKKVDVYWQMMLNLDVIVDIIMKEFKIDKKK